jgi:hypothetical protein
MRGALTSPAMCTMSEPRTRTKCYYDFATRRTKQIFRADKDLAEGMSLSRDRRYMLYSQMDEQNSDIMLVDHFS